MKITRKSPAVYTILIIALLLASTVYPLRLYHENVDISSGSVIPTQVSEVVDDVNDAGDYFLAQLPHLQSLDVWIEERISGETWMLQLFGHKEGGGFELLAEEYLPFPEEGSGFVRVPIDVDLETGEEYVFIVHGAGSEFRVGYETVDLSGNPDVPAYRLGFYQDTGIPAIAVMARFHYRVPLMREKSFFALGAIAIAALLLLAIIWLFFKQHPEKNTQTTVLSAARSVLTPVILGVGALACAAVWPMKLFDERPADIITYEIGIMLAAAVCLYALWHKREENSAHTNEPAAQNLAEEFSKAEKISHSVSTEENKSGMA